MIYHIKGMGCAGCVKTVSERLSAVEGVTAVTVDLSSATAHIETNKEVPFEALEKALADTHYSIHQEFSTQSTSTHQHHEDVKKKR